MPNFPALHVGDQYSQSQRLVALGQIRGPHALMNSLLESRIRRVWDTLLGSFDSLSQLVPLCLL